MKLKLMLTLLFTVFLCVSCSEKINTDNPIEDWQSYVFIRSEDADGETIEALQLLRNTVDFTVRAEKEFSIFLKIPAWSKSASVKVNGEEVAVAKNELGYTEVRRVWTAGDRLTVEFSAEVEIVKIDDSDACGKHPLAIRYGALVYSMQIDEDWRPTPGRRPVPEGWSWYEVHPCFTEADVHDFHEKLGLRRHQTGWNVALSENLTSSDVRIEEVDSDGYVWEAPPIKLHLEGYRAPYLCAPYPEKTFEPFGDKQIVSDKRELTLVPYGCTNLRITYFPRADLASLKGYDVR